MLVGFLLGFAACWLFAGAVVMRMALPDEFDAGGLSIVDDALPILIGILAWPYILGRDDDDA